MEQADTQHTDTAISRLQTIEDILGALETFNAAFPSTIESRVGDLQQYARKLRDKAFVDSAARDGTTVGLVAFYANDLVSGTAFLTHLAVTRPYWGMGVGLMLMCVCRRVSRDCGMTRLKLEVDTSNTRAIAFYELFGFSRCGLASPASYYMLLDHL